MIFYNEQLPLIIMTTVFMTHFRYNFAKVLMAKHIQYLVKKKKIYSQKIYENLREV